MFPPSISHSFSTIGGHVDQGPFETHLDCPTGIELIIRIPLVEPVFLDCSQSRIPLPIGSWYQGLDEKLLNEDFEYRTYDYEEHMKEQDCVVRRIQGTKGVKEISCFSAAGEGRIPDQTREIVVDGKKSFEEDRFDQRDPDDKPGSSWATKIGLE
ncbi:hypothetical protein TWF569_004099 [Orbilia oligospora]|nr:hypothetical protein TWF569_004099 [Orbilia oligospora]